MHNSRVEERGDIVKEAEWEWQNSRIGCLNSDLHDKDSHTIGMYDYRLLVEIATDVAALAMCGEESDIKDIVGRLKQKGMLLLHRKGGVDEKVLKKRLADMPKLPAVLSAIRYGIRTNNKSEEVDYNTSGRRNERNDMLFTARVSLCAKLMVNDTLYNNSRIDMRSNAERTVVRMKRTIINCIYGEFINAILSIRDAVGDANCQANIEELDDVVKFCDRLASLISDCSLCMEDEVAKTEEAFAVRNIAKILSDASEAMGK